MKNEQGAHYGYTREEADREITRLRELLAECINQMRGVVNSGMIPSTYLGGIGFCNALEEAGLALHIRNGPMEGQE